MLRIIKTNINLMNKVSLISLNLNEIFIEENEVSSLLCMTKWPLLASKSSFFRIYLEHKDGEGHRNTFRSTHHEQEVDCSDLLRLKRSLALWLEYEREFNF